MSRSARPISRTATAGDLELLLIDGNNLLHRTHGAVSPAAQRLLLARLKGSLPGVRKIVVFDGHRAAHGRAVELPASDVEWRYAGGPADEALLELIASTPWNRRGWTVLVTDDRALTERARSAGARTRRLDWLVELMGRAGGRAPGPGLGNTRT